MKIPILMTVMLGGGLALAAPPRQASLETPHTVRVPDRAQPTPSRELPDPVCASEESAWSDVQAGIHQDQPLVDDNLDASAIRAFLRKRSHNTIAASTCDTSTVRDDYGPLDVMMPIAWHNVCDDDGTNCTDQSQLDQGLLDLNTAFSSVGITFYVVYQEEIWDTDLNQPQIDLNTDELTGINPQTGAIDVYVTSIYYNVSSQAICGTGGEESIIMSRSCLGAPTNATSFPHEVGHHFGLFHTHQAQGTACPDSNTDELVDGSNCYVAGDLMCDTAADPGPYVAADQENPNLNGVVESGCTQTGSGVDCNGDTYNAPINNYMAYYAKSCRNNFTEEQIERMACTLDVVMTDAYVMEPGLATVACTPINMALFGNRLHVKCLEVRDGIQFFAYPLTNWNTVDRMAGIISSAITHTNTLYVQYDETDFSGESYGCALSNCRALQAVFAR